MTTSDLVKSQIQKAGYDSNFAEWWLAVAKMETGNFKSELATKYHNLFGFGLSTGKTTRNGYTVRPSDGHKFATYANPSDSVGDLLLYFNRNSYPESFPDVGTLVTFMKGKGFFEEDAAEYLKAVKGWL